MITMRRTETLVIDGEEFTVRPLNVSEMIEFSKMKQSPESVVYIVMSGTIKPKFDNINDIPLNAVVELATKIQQMTLDEVVKYHNEGEEDDTNPFVI